MKVRITPHPLSGAGEAVLSKSYAHRYLIAAALSGGSVSYGDSDDAARTARALYALGFDADFADDSVHYGLFHRPTSPVDISVGESGSTLRFLLPLAAALGVNAQFITAGRLSERPMDALAQTLAEHGAVYREQRIEGALTAGKYTIDATVSSQFVTGLLMALPLLEGDSEISLVGRMVSAPYVEITLDVLRASGISIDRRENGFFVHGGQKYRLNGAVVPGDFSGAAFPLTAGALGGPITLMGLDVSTAQGDKAILDVLRLAGAKVSTEEGKITVSRGELRSFTADVGETPDLAPILSVLAAFCEGESVLRTVNRLRDKESDRLSAIIDMLSRAGIATREEGDNLVIRGGVPKGGVFRSYSDHRMAMSEAVLAAYCVGESEIDDMACVGKSYPRFWEDFVKWGGNYEVER